MWPSAFLLMVLAEALHVPSPGTWYQQVTATNPADVPTDVPTTADMQAFLAPGSAASLYVLQRLRVMSQQTPYSLHASVVDFEGVPVALLRVRFFCTDTGTAEQNVMVGAKNAPSCLWRGLRAFEHAHQAMWLRNHGVQWLTSANNVMHLTNLVAITVALDAHTYAVYLHEGAPRGQPRNLGTILELVPPSLPDLRALPQVRPFLVRLDQILTLLVRTGRQYPEAQEGLAGAVIELYSPIDTSGANLDGWASYRLQVRALFDSMAQVRTTATLLDQLYGETDEAVRTLYGYVSHENFEAVLDIGRTIVDLPGLLASGLQSAPSITGVTRAVLLALDRYRLTSDIVSRDPLLQVDYPRRLLGEGTRLYTLVENADRWWETSGHELALPTMPDRHVQAAVALQCQEAVYNSLRLHYLSLLTHITAYSWRELLQPLNRVDESRWGALSQLLCTDVVQVRAELRRARLGLSYVDRSLLDCHGSTTFRGYYRVLDTLVCQLRFFAPPGYTAFLPGFGWTDPFHVMRGRRLLEWFAVDCLDRDAIHRLSSAWNDLRNARVVRERVNLAAARGSVPRRYGTAANSSSDMEIPQEHTESAAQRTTNWMGILQAGPRASPYVQEAAGRVPLAIPMPITPVVTQPPAAQRGPKSLSDTSSDDTAAVAPPAPSAPAAPVPSAPAPPVPSASAPPAPSAPVAPVQYAPPPPSPDGTTSGDHDDHEDMDVGEVDSTPQAPAPPAPAVRAPAAPAPRVAAPPVVAATVTAPRAPPAPATAARGPAPQAPTPPARALASAFTAVGNSQGARKRPAASPEEAASKKKRAEPAGDKADKGGPATDKAGHDPRPGSQRAESRGPAPVAARATDRGRRGTGVWLAGCHSRCWSSDTRDACRGA